MKKIIILLIAIITTANAFSQNVTSKTQTKQDTAVQVQYTCPMHPEVISNKRGKCPKCGMDLVKVKAKSTTAKVFYTCPMDPDVISDKPGVCPKCGMTLVKKE
jgi:predicted RNA-binding Zn-ribbon protein involved in translation (DUF1610 family)